MFERFLQDVAGAVKFLIFFALTMTVIAAILAIALAAAIFGGWNG
jgi:hypothetical protein